MPNINVATEMIIAVLSGVTAAIVSLIAARNSSIAAKGAAKKSDLEVLQAVLSSQGTTITGLVEENNRQRTRMKELEECVEAYEKQVNSLTAELNDWKNNYSKLKADYIQLQAEFKYFKRTNNPIQNLSSDDGGA